MTRVLHYNNKYTTKIFLLYTRNIAKIYQTYYQSITLIYQVHDNNILVVYQKYCSNMPNIWPEYYIIIISIWSIYVKYIPLDQSIRSLQEVETTWENGSYRRNFFAPSVFLKYTSKSEQYILE